MLWLSKGKKRCPVCRHWFVPGSKIDDQKHLHGEAWQRALREMEQIEREEKEKAITEQVNRTLPSTDVEQGIVETPSTVPSSESTATRRTSESSHSKSENDKMGWNISQSNTRDSENLPASEVNDIESHGVFSRNERPAVTQNTSSDKKSNGTTRERQISNPDG